MILIVAVFSGAAKVGYMRRGKIVQRWQSATVHHSPSAAARCIKASLVSHPEHTFTAEPWEPTKRRTEGLKSLYRL